MIQDLAEIGACFSHGAGSPLAKADSVPLAFSFDDYLSTFVMRGKIIAGHGVPAEAAADREASRFSGPDQAGRIFPGDSAVPFHRVAVAIIADHREIWIPVAGHP